MWQVALTGAAFYIKAFTLHQWSPECLTLRKIPVACPSISWDRLILCAGPVTILNWSFPRKDVARSVQAFQLALALRDEVADLEAAGCKIIQVLNMFSACIPAVQLYERDGFEPQYLTCRAISSVAANHRGIHRTVVLSRIVALCLRLTACITQIQAASLSRLLYNILAYIHH